MVRTPHLRDSPPLDGLLAQWPLAPSSLSTFSSGPAIGERLDGDAELAVMKHYSFGMAHALVSALTLCGNMMVMLVFLRNSSLRTPTYMFLMSLAFSDLVCLPAPRPAQPFAKAPGGSGPVPFCLLPHPSRVRVHF